MFHRCHLQIVLKMLYFNRHHKPFGNLHACVICRSMWLTAQTGRDLKRQIWWDAICAIKRHIYSDYCSFTATKEIILITVSAKSRIQIQVKCQHYLALTHPAHICNEQPPCLCVLSGAGWVAGGGKTCWCAAANLCQQAGPDDSHPSIRAGRESQSAHNPGSHVASPGLLSSHCWGRAGEKKKQAACINSSQDVEINHFTQICTVTPPEICHSVFVLLENDHLYQLEKWAWCRHQFDSVLLAQTGHTIYKITQIKSPKLNMSASF